ncbi:MAG: GMC family oxidoreductase [Saprospiraceae bacterium]|nr:GMC family oxidoreductase [Saprospiraceae bacterium]
MYQESTRYNAIVIGAGMSGGWSAKELCERGLKTLLLERGPDVKHIRDYPTATKNPWEFDHRGEMPLKIREENPSIARCYAYREDNAHFFVKDTDHPYVQDRPFDWIRGYQVGGKSLMWARQTQRWSDFDFEGPARDGFAVDWPIRYADLEPWYTKVERFVGISGNRDGIDVLPDGEFLPAWDLNCVQQYFQKSVKENYRDRHVIFGRCAHLSDPQPIHLEQNRGKCLARRECERGCPIGGYFSANSSTIPWAAKTGNLTLRPDAVVESILYDSGSGKAKGVRVIDANTKQVVEYEADLIFLNAGAINSIALLLNSTSTAFPEGLGNHNGLLGKYVAFHNYRGKINAICEDFGELREIGRKPSSGYLPRFRNVYKQETDFLRGYAAGFGASRGFVGAPTTGWGEQLRESILGAKPKLGPWRVGSHMMGATLPKEESYVNLDPTKKDEWGMPLIHIAMDYDDNDEKMLQDFFDQFSEMFERAGFKEIKTRDTKQAPGLDIHEMGGVRMGRDPKTSLLNEWNQLHTCSNVIVSDGACMTSTSTQNPSLTYMAIAARAAHHAVDQLEKGTL